MKTFHEGQKIEFIRDTEHARPWEPGVYVQSMEGQVSRGWHEVRTGADKFVVPARRIRSAREDEQA